MMTEIPFEVVYQDFDARLRRFIYRRVSDWDLTEDILQDVYIKLHHHIHSLNDVQHITAWLFMVTRNAIIDQHRLAKPTVELPVDLREQARESTDLYTELMPSVHRMLDCLDPGDRQVLQLADLQGVRQKDMASQLGLSYSGTKSRVQRARKKLREAFLECCHFDFDRRGAVMDYQCKCTLPAKSQAEESCADESC
jgi:RNA polymerase sigma-70 factor (ECF subfamily)